MSIFRVHAFQQGLANPEHTADPLYNPDTTLGRLAATTGLIHPDEQIPMRAPTRRRTLLQRLRPRTRGGTVKGRDLDPVVDVETTGLDPGPRDRMAEIAVVLLDAAGRVEQSPQLTQQN